MTREPLDEASNIAELGAAIGLGQQGLEIWLKHVRNHRGDKPRLARLTSVTSADYFVRPAQPGKSRKHLAGYLTARRTFRIARHCILAFCSCLSSHSARARSQAGRLGFWR